MTTVLCAMINFLLYIRKVLLIFKSSKGLSQHGYSFLIDQTPSAGRVYFTRNWLIGQSTYTPTPGQLA